MTSAPHRSGLLRRALRHWRSTDAAAARAFPASTLSAITDAIAAGERTHRGEVRLIIEKTLPWSALRAGLCNRGRALALFADHGVWDTEDNCGVLIYVNLADQQVDIVADRGIDRKIDAATWQAVCDTLTEGFARHAYEAASLDAVAQVNALLRSHFPADGARANELPNRPLML